MEILLIAFAIIAAAFVAGNYLDYKKSTPTTTNDAPTQNPADSTTTPTTDDEADYDTLSALAGADGHSNQHAS